MKNTYHVITCDRRYRSYPEIVATFTNKEKARGEARRLERVRKAANALRESEGSRERYPELYLVVAGDNFTKPGNVFDVIVDPAAVIYRA